MKARNLVAIIVLIVIVAGVFTTWKLFNSNNQVSVDDLHENTILEEIKTSQDKKIKVIDKKNVDDKIIVFYLDIPLSPSDEYDLSKTDVGFAYFEKTFSKWTKGHSGEYGSIEAYLIGNDKAGYTYEIFPSDEETTPSLILGVVTDPTIQNISLKNNYNSKIREVNYIAHDSYRLWYSTLEQIGNNSNTLLVNTTNESLTKNID
ncbi:hypothetical protein [Paenibacillus prosopidis]|uniref:Uncharacterized protein n=1 Tax=Paenibacillus prosopidis TaxID=630520 RepID=A0A368VP22_9BACL|nr:hypothetical protein [Paenibacillus prosopidis]RCW41540.1 hypothetical protein DFP97_12369 [Paenibacillus prosopidis]